MSLRTVAAAVAMAGIITLGGCAPASGYGAETAQALQSQVLTVTEASKSGDYEGALVRLGELEASLKDALAREQVTQERFDSILAAIALVRTDLDAAIAAQQEPTPAPGDGNGNGNGNGNGKDKDKD